MSIKVCLNPEGTNAIKACYATGFKRAFLYRELPGRLKIRYSRSAIHCSAALRDLFTGLLDIKTNAAETTSSNDVINIRG